MSKSDRRRLRSLIMAIPIFATAPAASATTLMEALTEAYRSNPTLQGARAGQRSTVEQINVQRADGLPAAGVTGNYSENIDTAQRITTPYRSAGAQASVQAPVFNGGAIRNAVAAARLRAEAGQQDLRSTEANVFVNVVTAYQDVIRDTSVVALNRQNVQQLEVNLRASNDRFEVGDLTRTDVAQSQSRLSLARANLELSQAQLSASQENYTALVGMPPVDLQPAFPLSGLPDSQDAAVETALSDNPDVTSSQRARAAANRDVKSTRGQGLPSVSVFANQTYNHFLNSERRTLVGYDHTNATSAGASITVPLYQGGRVKALTRAAQAREDAAIERVVQLERGITAQTRATYASWKASTLAIEATRQAVSAAELSLEGVKAENSVGTRTVLDILNAEQEVLNAQVQYVTAQRNAYVAAFSLLAAMGHAEATDLGIRAPAP